MKRYKRKEEEEEEEDEQVPCFHCGKQNARLKSTTTNNLFCSEVCFKKYKKLKPLYEELEQILKHNFDTCNVRDGDDMFNLVLGNDIQNDLITRGVCLVKIENIAVRNLILDEININIVATFPRVNYINNFVTELNKRKYEDLQIWGTGKGMINTPPIDPENYERLTHPILNTVECKNAINAKNNIRMWEILTRYNNQLHPSNWFTEPLCSKDYRTQVSEDGIKIKKDESYKPTPIHYDGQLSETNDMSTRRVQIIYTTDTGPVRLFAVPGSHLLRVKEIIQIVTGITPKAQFARENFDKHPIILELLYKYGVSIGSSAGLLMFCASVWHFESASSQIGHKIQHEPQISFNMNKHTKKSSVFRIYCGIVTVTPNHLLKDLLVIAYMREHGWAMESFARTKNREHSLFVNEKNAINWKVKTAITASEIDEFNRLKNASVYEMKYFLSQFSNERLLLHGLLPSDLKDDRIIIVDNNNDGE
jgi:hypothetical protein